MIWLAGLSACVSIEIAPDDCPPGTQKLAGCPPVGAVTDEFIGDLYARRAWVEPSELTIDPIALGRDAKIPINKARAKFIGSTDVDGLNSLAAKLWLIEHAEHTVDVVYYIFREDLVGLAMLGALCDAVQRGVDVRIMVDSMGSVSFDKDNLQALESCAIDAGFIRNADGEMTIHKARVQAVIFNAASNIFVNHNRRSHDKLLVVDGHFHEKSAIMTGGRNISLDYYGILADGSPNPHSYRDAEIFLRGETQNIDEPDTVGEVSEIYYSLLFLFKNNKFLTMSRMSDPRKSYRDERQDFRDGLGALKELPEFQKAFATMPEYTSQDFHTAEVRLVHQLTNLTNKKVVANAVENAHLNPNSIATVTDEFDEREFHDYLIVSPYLFAAQYKDSDGNIELDEAVSVLDLLDKYPQRTIEVITNSVLTSDNFFAQSVIDMDMAPRLLLSKEAQNQWLAKVEDGEFNPEFVESEAWTEMINHPRLKIYETGRLDDSTLGGDVEYSKLHAKYIVSDDDGFVGTTNFDYRSRLYNNEMGFFFTSPGLAEDLRRNSEFLLGTSYLWGSPEWLEMRKRLMEQDGSKSFMIRRQRSIYKTLKSTGLQWFF